jgi:hypothetical protein
MPKKTKRQVRRTTPVIIPGASTMITSNGGRTATDREFTPDYTHVTNDLKRIGILAGSFFVVLVALSFFMR